MTLCLSNGASRRLSMSMAHRSGALFLSTAAVVTSPLYRLPPKPPRIRPRSSSTGVGWTWIPGQSSSSSCCITRAPISTQFRFWLLRCLTAAVRLPIAYLWKIRVRFSVFQEMFQGTNLKTVCIINTAFDKQERSFFKLFRKISLFNFDSYLHSVNVLQNLKASINVESLS